MLLFKEKEMALEKESELIERRILLAFSQKQAITEEIAPKKLIRFETSCDICADIAHFIPDFKNLEDLTGHIIDFHTNEENKSKFENIINLYNNQFEENVKNENEYEYEGGRECAYWTGLYEKLFSAGYPKNFERMLE
jgi:hypothetical protein